MTRAGIFINDITPRERSARERVIFSGIRGDRAIVSTKVRRKRGFMIFD